VSFEPGIGDGKVPGEGADLTWITKKTQVCAGVKERKVR